MSVRITLVAIVVPSSTAAARPSPTTIIHRSILVSRDNVRRMPLSNSSPSATTEGFSTSERASADIDGGLDVGARTQQCIGARVSVQQYLDWNALYDLHKISRCILRWEQGLTRTGRTGNRIDGSFKLQVAEHVGFYYGAL